MTRKEARAKGWLGLNEIAQQCHLTKSYVAILVADGLGPKPKIVACEKMYRPKQAEELIAAIKTRKRKNALPQNDVVEACKLFEAGWTLRAIATKLHHGAEQLSKRMRAAGCEIKNRRGDSIKNHLPEIVQLSGQGYTQAQIGRRFGVCQGTISLLLISNGYRRNGVGTLPDLPVLER
jgi:hypothetical protein